MTKELVWGVLAVAVVGALIWHHKHDERVVVAPVSTVAEHSPFAETGNAPQPTNGFNFTIPRPLPRPAAADKARAVTKKPVYHKVRADGLQGAVIDCKQVPLVAKQFTTEQVLTAAKKYGLSPEQLDQLRVCLN